VGGFTVEAPKGLRTLARADTIVIPGTADVRRDPSPKVLSTLRRAHERGARLVSVCSGAFVLAATGLLDGRRAATHWRYAELLQQRFPRVEVDSSVLYVDQGDILTSAGTAAGIDACLHVVRTDHGVAVANRVARRMVVAPHRDGGQAQFIEQPLARLEDDPIATIVDHVRKRLGEGHSVEDLAARAHLSPRQFSRRFKAATGTSPARWLIRERVEASLPLLENDTRGVEEIGRSVGFNSPAAFRRHFRATVGLSPAAWRAQFRRA
jgi:AraC family transcriptional activator FtrA